MITMSIDASSKATGIAIFKEKELVYYECIYATNTNSLDRINKMVARIKELYETWKVTNVIMEDVNKLGKFEIPAIGAKYIFSSDDVKRLINKLKENANDE